MDYKKPKLFIEAVPLVDRQMSGIPHALAGLVAALAANKKVTDHFEIVLIVPGERMGFLSRWPGLENCSRKAIPMKFRVMNGLGRRGLLPPMDLLIGQGIYLFGNFFSWPLTRRSRSLTYVHDICFALHPEYVQPDNQRMLARNTPRFIAQTNYVITVSENAKQEIVRYFNYDASKVIVLANGVDSELYKHYPDEAIELVKTQYGLAGKKYFLFVGNIEPRKNIERLIAAMTSLPKDYALLLIGSDGWLNEKVFADIEQANENGHLFIKPKTYVPDNEVARLLSGALALALPSLYEGFGMPALEAMAVGTPAVVADIPPLREIVGDAGIYCNPQDTDSIAASLQRAATLPAGEKKRLIEFGLTRSKQFTWAASANKLADHLLAIEKELSQTS